MTARDDYPPILPQWEGRATWAEMCDEIDRLRAEVARWRYDPGAEMSRGVKFVETPHSEDDS